MHSNVKLTTKEFIQQANKVHHNKYDYSKTEYVRSHDKVCIICPIHGEFWQSPDNHKKGKGCPYCGKSHPNNQQTFVEKATKVHHGFYDYSKTKFTKNRNKVIITCPIHGDFEQEANSHLQGVGCPECANAKRGQYDYSGRVISRRKTCLKKYGVENVMQIEEFRKKNEATKHLHNSFNTSKPEEACAELLEMFFGSDDVVRQYSQDSRYPFRCDFYIKSRDMFIELNVSWTHGMHWFESTGAKDKDTLNQWKNKHTAYYDNAVTVFGTRDPLKRKMAAEAKLNYLTFWDPKLQDVQMWLSQGAPDGHDYDVEYSWLPQVDFKPSNKKYSKLTPRTMSQIVKQYQFSVFYEHELKMWNDLSIYHKGIQLRPWLFMNRFRYLKKSPIELTPKMLLSGFAISSLHRGFSEFDATLMLQVIDEFKPTYIFDPFAGWGERALSSASKNVKYYGVDINASLQSGYNKMCQDYQLDDVTYKIADALQVVAPEDADMVITCPPYYDLEHYTDQGLENKSYDDFLEAWKQVVLNCNSVKYFCFQINQKYRDDMLQVVKSCGYKLLESKRFKSNKGSHLQRNKQGKSTKKEFEEMLILEKE